ncbi:MAG: phosphoribosylanthranilate isomerase [Halanaerobiaceae bacterium]
MPQLTNQATKIKICGMTNQADIETAVGLNVDALGFILAKSPRQVTLNQARDLTAQLPPFIDAVAVVVNPDKDELAEIVSSRIFTAIQFHGSEDLESLEDIPLKVIKAISISDQSDLKGINKYQDQADYLLFDTKIGDRTGGTGESFDWSLLEQISLNQNYILAGGLGPDNIREALNRLKPAAVDLNSRLEISPGKKDPELMKEAVNLIKQTDAIKGEE